MQHFSSLQEYHEYLNWPLPEHPMLSVTSLASGKGCRKSSPPITTDFYHIKLKKVKSGNMMYGRTKYDFKNGSMIFISPSQVIQWDSIDIEAKGFIITIHKDYIIGQETENNIKKYDFFSYSVNEALHLSPSEENIMENIFDHIQTEYHNNQDEFSKEIMLSHLDILLKYADRFYKRQFITRKELNTDLSRNFKDILRNYFESGSFLEFGTPKIDWIANKLSVSARYLSHSLKAETGKTAIEHIHLFLIDEAKNLLLEPNKSVSEIAYQLGFEYPQYFSRLFKKKVGISPTSFREEYLVN